jgi:putative N-acetyltransferase (TIGR04045 family)
VNKNGSSISPATEQVGSQPGCRLADAADLLRGHMAVREAVFVREQGVFDDDRDFRDDDPATLHVVGVADGGVVAAVRLYPLDFMGTWRGDRLAILPAMRRGRMAAQLVRYAVMLAGERGGHEMHAMIQLPNVRFFRGLDWHESGPVISYAGRPHQPMRIGLSRFR